MIHIQQLTIDLAKTLILRENLDAALDVVERAMQIDNESAPVHACRGQVLFEQKKYKDALAAFYRCKELLKNSPRLDLSIDQWIEKCNQQINQN